MKLLFDSLTRSSACNRLSASAFCSVSLHVGHMRIVLNVTSCFEVQPHTSHVALLVCMGSGNPHLTQCCASCMNGLNGWSLGSLLIVLLPLVWALVCQCYS